MKTSSAQQNLRDSLAQLRPSLVHLQDSYEFCRDLCGRVSLTRSELVEADALTSRFARTSDILVKQVFRALDEVELEDSGSIIDRLNRAHKRGLFDDEAMGRTIRQLRNEIAHEYRIVDYPKFLDEIIAFTPPLLDMCRRTVEYSERIKFS
ncbi:hypothetical protein [Fundidesulfovibrio putealis]|uniref:hypothetical protein n=1 Tax=Fundidesulfovibrio putealis TaxID=270496 RepID=UPI000403AD93|nr:hypothetical protein [Fundidesulfovibrio putealis]